MSLPRTLQTAVFAGSCTSVATRVRAYLRRRGIGRWVMGGIWHLFVRKYEGRFREALTEGVRPGDVAWDVGANVGECTRLFINAVGPEGTVIAIEPAPASAEVCREVTASQACQCRVVETALSDEVGEGFLRIGIPTAGTNGLTPIPTEGVRVRISTGDALLEELGAAPNVIKIDVEGYELEVLCGMRRVLATPALRLVFIEVHFGLLETRGIPDPGTQITTLLNQAGFRTRWLDFSHLMGSR